MSNNIDVIKLDLEAARRERDEMREERDRVVEEIRFLAEKMVYRGNSIEYIHSKAKNYGDALTRAWGAFSKVSGVRAGTPLDEAIAAWGLDFTAMIEAVEAYVEAEAALSNREIGGINAQSIDRLQPRVHAARRDLDSALARVRGDS